MAGFTRRILDWYARAGRHDLPWKLGITPYRIWISEIMLQQTQVKTVIPYFERFITAFPHVSDLAGADLDYVLHLWSGLGYYSRARNLHKTARIVRAKHNGELPGSIDELVALPGIGRSTAGAILAMGMNQVYPILDGNVKRVLCRYHAIKEWPGDRETEKHLWQLAERYTSRENPADYTQAIMDLGALICTRTRPGCEQCPVSAGCQARAQHLQEQIPGKRPVKKLPVKQTRFVMIENNRGQVLLQRRPPSGIWGGLWGFPECPVDSDMTEWLASQFGYKVDLISTEQGLRHIFTHFRLDITPVKMKLVSQPDRVGDEENLYWFTPTGDNKSIGIATPVQKLMTKYYTT